MIDRFVIPFKMTGKDGQEWIGQVDGDYIFTSPVFLKSQLQSDPKMLDFFNKEWLQDGNDYLDKYGLPLKSTKLRPDLYWISFAKGKALFAYLDSNEQQINDIDFVEPEYPVSEVRVIAQVPNMLLASTVKGKGQKEWGVIDCGGSIFIKPLYDAINVSVAADGTLRFARTLKGIQIVYNQDGMEVH